MCLLSKARRTGDSLNIGSDPFVALAADARRPVHRGALADLILPFWADLGQVVHPDKSRSGTIGPGHYRYVLARQLNSRVEAPQDRTVPFLHPSGLSVRRHGAGNADAHGVD